MPFADLKDGMTITLVEGGFKLKEVKIKAERIKAQETRSHIRLLVSARGKTEALPT